MSLYQKYRPTKFEEVVSQQDVKTFLQNIIAKNKKDLEIPHSYLFCGGHGTGKTTLARIFARDLGTNEADIFEMDAASNNGIGEVRDLKESVYSLPVYSKFKIYILDEAHGMSKQANNAILKVLEEPPKHVIFIFCTTDPEKMLDTVISRCQLVNLSRADIPDLVHALENITKKEGVDVEKGALEEIAKNSKSSFRDAIGNLERSMHTFGSAISLENIHNLFDASFYNANISEDVIDNLIKKDFKGIINLISKQDKVEGLYAELIEYIHSGMLIRQTGESSKQSKFVQNNPTFFTSANMLFFLEKESLFYEAKDKKIALIAILGNFIESH